MELNEYLDFNNPNGIRIKGTRVNLEDVVYLASEGMAPGQIHRDLPVLTLEQIHAALAYYYRNRPGVDEYMARQDAEWEADKKKQKEDERPEVVKRLLRLRAEQKGKVPI